MAVICLAIKPVPDLLFEVEALREISAVLKTTKLEDMYLFCYVYPDFVGPLKSSLLLFWKQLTSK